MVTPQRKKIEMFLIVNFQEFQIHKHNIRTLVRNAAPYMKFYLKCKKG